MIKLLGNRILVRREVKKNASGIIVSDQENIPRGEIIALGDGPDIKDSSLAVGNNVVFSEMAGENIDLKGENHLVIKLSDIIGII